LKAYMIVNFRTRGISRGTYKITRTFTLIKKKSKASPLHGLIPK
jgi:hypothetical protein